MSCNCRNRLGDPCRKHDGHDCAVCGHVGCLDTVPCQGSDTCTARICEGCRDSQQCHGCELYACPDHLAVCDGDRLCDICRADTAPRKSAAPGLEDNRPLEVMA